MSKPVAILSHRLYVPSEHVTPSMLRSFTRRIFVNRQSCSECGNDDPESCRGCRFEPTLLRFYKEHEGGWHSFASGDLGKVYSVFKDFKFKRTLNFTILSFNKLYDMLSNLPLPLYDGYIG